jgi:hypothetical protein
MLRNSDNFFARTLAFPCLISVNAVPYPTLNLYSVSWPLSILLPEKTVAVVCVPEAGHGELECVHCACAALFP